METQLDPPPKFQPEAWPKERPKVTVPSYIGEDEQVANWLFHSGAGDILHDFSGGENHAEIYGGEWRDGPYGWGLYFNGLANQGAQLEPFPDDRGSKMTILAWLKPTADLAEQRVVSKWGVEVSWLLSVGDNTTNEPRWVAYDGSYHILDAGEDVVVNSWNCLGATLDAPNDVMRLYLDGSESPGSPLSEAMDAPNSTTNDVVIGAQKDTSASGDFANNMEGVLAWIILYVGRVLTDMEISEFYESTKNIL